MLKKFLSVALTAALVAGVGSTVMAEDGVKVGGKAGAYFGQYSDGVDGHASYLKAASEGQLYAMGTKGSLSAYAEYEQRTNNGRSSGAGKGVATGATSATGAATKINTANGESQRWAKWSADGFALKFGTIVPAAGVGYAVKSGLYTTDIPGVVLSLNTYLEADGMEASFKAGPASVGITLFEGDQIQGSTGQTLSASVVVPMDALGIKFHYISSTKDDYTKDSDDALGSSAMALGVMYKISDAMHVAFDYSTKSKAKNTSDNYEYGTTDFQFGMKGAGPGALIVGLEMYDNKEAGDPVSKATKTNLVYKLDSGLQFLYATSASTPEGGDTTTASYIAAGAALAF